MPYEETKDWAVPDAEWLDIGDDYVFICCQRDGTERWFRLRADYAEELFRAALDVTPAPWTGILGAYQAGVGPWGDAPWTAPDFHEVIRQLSCVSEDVLLAGVGKQDLIEAYRALMGFLKARYLAGDKLIIDDGSGASGRFPEAGAGWTETGRPLDESLLVSYRPGAGPGGYELATLVVAADTLNQLARSGIEPASAFLHDFLADEDRAYRSVKIADLMKMLSGLAQPDSELVDFLKQAASEQWPVVLQSAGRFPVVPPPS